MNMGWGVAGVLVGGLLNGSFVAPMKRMSAWRWENSWLVYSVSGLLVIPWIVAFATVPQLVQVFQGSSSSTLLQVVLFGLGWGVGSVLFGLGVNRLGLAVGYGIILGLIAPIGTFLPLVVLHRERLWTLQGETLIAGTLVVIVGIVFLAVAGKRRERESRAQVPMVQAGFFGGLIVCILAGIFSPMLNFSFVFGQELQTKAQAAGATASMASNAIWSVTLTAGFLVNAGYCVWLLQQNGTWKLFREAGGARHWINGTLMGLLCFGSFLVYGMGATALGPLGGIVGWPLFMSMSLITSNALGALSGEWKGASRKSYGYSLVGIALLILAIVVISRGGNS
ncbi:MAG TPA: L-rhamnose/proton symporter RhaT [Dongiaceae bacterium]|nr:L-rhamnose/proton symporter RhaT [Dongiaceae bacterium]